jgi:hypothetical protein
VVFEPAETRQPEFRRAPRPRGSSMGVLDGSKRKDGTMIRRLICGIVISLLAAVAAGQTSTLGMPEDPRYGLLTPLPETGGVPAIVALMDAASERELAARARAREYEQQLRRIRREHFGPIKAPEIRLEGLTLLREFTDPAAFRPMIEVLADEKDDVQLAMLDHFAQQGDEGQAALAYTAIVREDDAIRNEALERMTNDPAKPVLRVLDQALRSRKHEIANNAGLVAGRIGAIQTIPLLIFAQATSDPVPAETGDLAWIAIETQHTFVADLAPVVGDNAGAFQPVLGVVSEGTLLRVMDAVVVVYRTEVHASLVNLTTHDWGRSTAHLGYDMRAWWAWYNTEYVPFKNEQARLAAIEDASGQDPGDEQDGDS